MTEAGTKRKDQKARTRRHLIEVARKLFEDRGFDQTTIRVVASEAGVGLGTIFTHFPNKESLLVATLLDEMEQFQEDQWDSMPESASLREQVIHLARKGFDAWLRRPALSRVMLREMVFKPGPARDQLRKLDQLAMKRMAEHLESAKKRGDVRADADTGLAARTAFAYYLSIVLFGLEDLEARAREGQRAATSSPTEEELRQAAVDAMVAEVVDFTDQLFAGIGPKRRKRPQKKGRAPS